MKHARKTRLAKGLAQRRPWPTLTLTVLLAVLPAMAAELKPKTIEAFNRYVQLTEARIDQGLARGNPFLWVDHLPEARRTVVLEQLRRGDVVHEKMREIDANRKEVPDPDDGMIHHWMGMAFIPGVKLEQVLALVQDYDNHGKVYKPDVVEARIREHHGDDYRVYFRFLKGKLGVTAVLNTEHDVHYFRSGPARAGSRSHTTRIAEVENPGQPNEREKPVGNDRGFLWRLNTYWLFEERDAGVYVQCESVSLSRDIPPGLGWLIGPVVNGLPRDSLKFTLGSTRSALVK